MFRALAILEMSAPYIMYGNDQKILNFEIKLCKWRRARRCIFFHSKEEFLEEFSPYLSLLWRQVVHSFLAEQLQSLWCCLTDHVRRSPSV